MTEAAAGPQGRAGWAVGCAVAVLVAGFGALLGFWLGGSYSAQLPGLFEYPSATWGDGLLLPLLAFCLCRLIAGLPVADGRRPTLLAGVVGAVAGGLVILTWVTDPAPSLNWTMPQPHRLNMPGVWHAGFLVLASGLFAALWVELLRRLRHASRVQVDAALQSAAAAGAVAGTTGYAWLARADSGRAAGTAAGRGSLLALGLAALVLLVCLAWAGRGALGTGGKTALTGLLLAFVVVLFAETHWHALVFLALAAAVGAGLALASAASRGRDLDPQELLAVPAAFAIITLLVVREDVDLWHVLVAPFAAVICAGVLRLLYAGVPWSTLKRTALEYLAAAGISASLLAASVFGLWQREHGAQAYITGGFLLTIVGAVLGGVFLPFFKADFEELMQVEGDEKRRQPDYRPSPEQTRIAVRTWLRLLGYAGSALMSMLVLTIALAPSLGWETGTARLQRPPLWPAALVAGALLLLLARAVPAFAAANRPHPDHGPKPPPTGTAVPAWCCALAGVAACAVFIPGLLRDGTLQLLAIVQTVLLTAFAAQAILGNGAWLHLTPVRRAAGAAVGTVSLAVLLGVYWSLTSAVRPGGAAASPGATFLGWLVAAVVIVVPLVMLTACSVYVAGGRPYLTDYAPVHNLGQDCFHLLVMWFVLGWVPQFVLANVPAGKPERWAAIGTILAGFLLLFGPAFLWILENNDTHVERQRRVKKVDATGALADLAQATSSGERIGTLPSRIAALVRSLRRGPPPPAPTKEVEAQEWEAFLVRLSGHTAMQNTIALLLAGSSVIGVVGVSAGLTPTATGLSSLPNSD
jgi:hypothetical protein